MENHDTEQYRIFLDNLQREEQRENALNNIKTLLAFKPAGEVSTTLKDVGISKIVQCLNTNVKSHVDLTCEVLKICFDKFETGEVIKNYTSHIMYLLRHEKDCVRRLAIDEVYKSVVADPAILPVPQYVDVYVAVSQLVSDRDIGIANKAILITSNLPHEAYPKVLEEMKIALEYNTSSKCNAYEVIANISAKSSEIFNLCAEQGYIELLINELQTDDVLYQLNILELLSRLAVRPHGINFLVKNGGLARIAEMTSQMQNNPMWGLLIPGYMKFYGCIAHIHPKEVFEKHPVLLDLVFDAIEANDQTVLPIALDTLGYIGTTMEGKLSLPALGSRFTQAVEQVGRIINNSTTDIKTRALHCFASLISIEKDPRAPKMGPIDNRITLMTREWFRNLSIQPAAIDVLFGMCKNPFPEIRLAAYALLDAVCQHRWGEELVARAPGFIEYLLDRSVDPSKESKEAKYEVIKKLSRSIAFDDANLERIQTYVEQGPYYSESTLEVAMEEEN